MFIKEWVKGESKWHVGWVHYSADTQLIITHRFVAKTATLYRLCVML